MSETTKPTLPPIDQSRLTVSYANVCRVAQTPSEVFIDFGINPNFYIPILEGEPAKLENRIVMTPDAAKRLCLSLVQTIQKYEALYGPIEIDFTKRIKNLPAQPPAPAPQS